MAALAAMLPLAALYLLAGFDVPLGQPDYLVYRYSPLFFERLSRCLPAWLLSVGIVAVVARWERSGMGSERKLPLRERGWIAACWTGLVAWSFWSPPQFMAQHLFNLNSPAQDGAFVWEAGEVDSLRGYLSRDFAQRLTLDPADMRGTRVLSNPPGTTILAYAARKAVEERPRLRRAIEAALDWYDPPPVRESPGGPATPELRADHKSAPPFVWPAKFPTAMLFGLMLTVLWGLTFPVAFMLTRGWLPPAAALTVALACVWNPSSLNFTPGKDPAQSLLVVCLMLAGLRSYQTLAPAWALLFGGLLMLSMAVSLVFFWLGFILLVGTGWHAAGSRRVLQPWLRRCVIPALLGALMMWLIVRMALGFDILGTAIQVARRYPELQRYLIHGAYTFVGFPVFLLFAGPMFWVLMTQRTRVEARPSHTASSEARDGALLDSAGLGRILTRVCAACMIYCYFFANNNESARLWLPFLIMLTVFMSMSRADLFGPNAFRLRVGRVGSLGAASLLILAQIFVTTLHWSRMDARESEWRILTGRNWN